VSEAKAHLCLFERPLSPQQQRVQSQPRYQHQMLLSK
jgi:hypothetical protein